MHIIDNLVIKKIKNNTFGHEYCLKDFSLSKKIQILARRHNKENVSEILARSDKLSSQDKLYLSEHLSLEHLRIMKKRKHSLIHDNSFFCNYADYLLREKKFKEFYFIVKEKWVYKPDLISLTYLVENSKTSLLENLLSISHLIDWESELFNKDKYLFELPESVLKKIFVLYNQYRKENKKYNGDYAAIFNNRDKIREFNLLIKYDIIDVNSLDNQSKHVLCYVKDVNDLNFLIGKNADVNFELPNGNSILFENLLDKGLNNWGEQENQPEAILEILIKNGAVLKERNSILSNGKIKNTKNINAVYYPLLLKHNLLNVKEIKIDLDDILNYAQESMNKQKCTTSILAIIKTHKDFTLKNINLSGLNHLSVRYKEYIKQILFSFSSKEIKYESFDNGLNLFMFSIKYNLSDFIKECIETDTAFIKSDEEIEIMNFHKEYKITAENKITVIENMDLNTYKLLYNKDFIDHSVSHDMSMLSGMKEDLIEYLFENKILNKNNMNPVINYHIDYQIRGLKEFVLESGYINAKTRDGSMNMLNRCSYNKRYVRFLLSNGIEILSHFEEYDEAIRSQIVHEYQKRIKEEKISLNTLISVSSNSSLRRERL